MYVLSNALFASSRYYTLSGDDMGTPVEEGERGEDEGEEEADDYTNSAGFVVATLLVVTSALTRTLDRRQPPTRRPCDLLGPRLWATQDHRPWTQTVRMTGE